MKRYIILVLVLLGLYKVLATPLIEVRARRVCPIVPHTTEINPKEADLFFKQWAEYVNRGYKQKVPEDFSVDEKNMADRLPWIVRFWMAKNCIDPKRFYYVEQRFRSILKTCALKKHTDAVASVLEKQMAAGMDEEKQKWYQDLIEKQHQLPQIEGITDAELEMVKGHEQDIEELLK